MKQTFNLIDDNSKAYAIEYIHRITADGKTKVTVDDIGTKTQRQRGFQWRLYEDIAKSGIGRHDNATDVAREAKYMFALPIFKRDDEVFQGIIEAFQNKHPDPEMWRRFLDAWVHTEKFSVSQMNEFLENLQHYWLSKGVNLTNPDLYGL